MSKIITLAFKAAILSSTLLCIGISVLDGNFSLVIIPLCFISIIVTFVIASIMTTITIAPFDEFTGKLSPTLKFNLYFPFYALTYFLGCFFIAYSTNFELYTTLISGITYITAMQTWVWFFKQKTTKS